MVSISKLVALALAHHAHAMDGGGLAPTGPPTYHRGPMPTFSPLSLNKLEFWSAVRKSHGYYGKYDSWDDCVRYWCDKGVSPNESFYLRLEEDEPKKLLTIMAAFLVKQPIDADAIAPIKSMLGFGGCPVSGHNFFWGTKWWLRANDPIVILTQDEHFDPRGTDYYVFEFVNRREVFEQFLEVLFLKHLAHLIIDRDAYLKNLPENYMSAETQTEYPGNGVSHFWFEKLKKKSNFRAFWGREGARDVKNDV